MSLDGSEGTSEENLIVGDLEISQSANENDPARSQPTAADGGNDTAAEAAPSVDPLQDTTIPPVTTRKVLDEMREQLNKDLIDRCLDVIRTHPDATMEVSDLINAMVKTRELQDEVCSTLTFAISSLSLDEDDKKQNGKCIATYSYLLALLLQNEDFFQQSLDTLGRQVEEYIDFVKAPSPTAAEELPPWIPYILLILEVLLRHDERPVAAKWKPPTSLEESVAQPVVEKPTPLVDDGQRGLLLDHLLDLLPRIGKEEMLATSVLRILVILTRTRTLAKRVGDKKNLQRLFLMAKQLAGSGSERLKQSRMTAHIITILRHIIEDEDVLKQILRAEIRSEFANITRGPRPQPDLMTYLRHMTPLALRAPDIFVEVTNEVVEASMWSFDEDHPARPLYLKLKSEPDSRSPDTQTVEESSSPADVKLSTEPADKDMTDAPRPQQDTKRPLVENPDGVVHFLLSELVNYREVDDKEIGPPSNDPKAGSATKDQGKEPVSEPTDADGKDRKPEANFQARGAPNLCLSMLPAQLLDRVVAELHENQSGVHQLQTQRSPVVIQHTRKASFERSQLSHL
jgi:E3 ubiquitin-protein ligase HUWE1